MTGAVRTQAGAVTGTATTLAQACRILAAEDVSRISFGHVSARTGDTVTMRGRPPADQGLEFCTAADIVEVDGHGRAVRASDVTPPREVHAHLGIYARRPDVQAVVHVHPRYVVALSVAGVELNPVYGAYDPDGCRLGARDLSTFPSSVLIDTPELGLAVADALGDRSACVLTGHGIVCAGDSIESAVLTAIAVTELAHVTWLAAAAGIPRPIPVHEQNAVVLDGAAAERAPSAVRGVRPSHSAWQHFAERDRRRHLQTDGPAT